MEPWWIRYERRRPAQEDAVLNHNPSPPVLVPGHEFTGVANLKRPSPGSKLPTPQKRFFLLRKENHLSTSSQSPVRCLRMYTTNTSSLFLCFLFTSKDAQRANSHVSHRGGGLLKKNCPGPTELTRAWSCLSCPALVALHSAKVRAGPYSAAVQIPCSFTSEVIRPWRSFACRDGQRHYARESRSLPMLFSSS